jgi:gamma-glutamylcyclotransferase (GGCT)/AIG2-like uncharacterized protein YtfP
VQTSAARSSKLSESSKTPGVYRFQNYHFSYLYAIMESSRQLLFVYGSLRSGFNHPAYSYISTHFTLVASARVKGKLYNLGDYPAAIPTEDEHYIMGELYSLKEEQEFSWAIAQIDDYEGVNPEPGEAALYRRALTSVYFNDQTTNAWIYWYNNSIEGYPLIASGDVLEYLQQKNS